MIQFNKPSITGHELEYIKETIENEKISGNGMFTKRCQDFFVNKYGFKKCLLTTSGTDALEMCAILSGVGPGDEVIVPSYTFVSTALAFIRQGARVVFCDSRSDNPNIDTDSIESLITNRTKVIVPVHYAGMACDMDEIMDIAKRHSLIVVEDAAQAIDSYYRGADGSVRALGSIGNLAAFSFHETKNVTSGEGGMLTINDPQFIRRSEIIWEKGTNRAEFFRGVVNKYGWVDIGSSFLPSELNAAFLWAQLENLGMIQARRIDIWNTYFKALKPIADKGYFMLPKIPAKATNNAHMFYMVFPDLEKRSSFISYMKENGILAVFHYLALHQSEYYKLKHDGRELPNCDRYSDCLVRLPMYYSLTESDQAEIIGKIVAFFE